MRRREWDAVSVAVVVLAGVVVSALLGALVGAVALSVDASVIRVWAPTVSAAIATAGLLVTAYTYNRSTRRQRKAQTHAVWTQWQADTRRLRRKIHEGSAGELVSPKPRCSSTSAAERSRAPKMLRPRRRSSASMTSPRC